MFANLLKEVQELYQEIDFLTDNPSDYDVILGKLDELSQDKNYVESSLSLRWHIFYLKKDYSLSLADLDRLIKLNPMNRNAFYNRGTVQQHLKNYKKALKDFQNAMDLATKQQDDDLLDAVEHHIIELKEKVKTQ
jgi:tetratricopeptide (TPR) repeat protein